MKIWSELHGDMQAQNGLVIAGTKAASRAGDGAVIHLAICWEIRLYPAVRFVQLFVRCVTIRLVRTISRKD